jgi:hypothetical protein
MRAKKEILEDVQALEIAQLRTENKLLRGNITRLKNILSGRNPMRVIIGNLDEECRDLLQIAQTSRQQIESLDCKYAESCSNYESSLHDSYEDSKTQAKTARGIPYEYLQQQLDVERVHCKEA